MNNLALMLSEITSINRKYDRLSEVTGDRFNIFRVLSLQSLAVI
jgi:hypothetical protein